MRILAADSLYRTYTVSQKNDTDVAHYNLSAHQQILVILAEMLLRECTNEWYFVFPYLLTNVSALPGETWTPEIGSPLMLYTENETALPCYIFNTHQPIIITFGKNIYGVCAIISLFNFSCPCAIISLFPLRGYKGENDAFCRHCFFL